MLSVFNTAQAIATVVALSLSIFYFYRMLAVRDDNEFLRWRARLWKLGIAAAVMLFIFALAALFILPA
ncbi:hypothetical protein PsAD2_01590 [Pseudovibrio axinellae]|uniref:Major facilitator superfamily (MFS) profile domain-containing protein n=1 Tax=Pseudovibrio axinellae TaxID=989403 RepID=A0A165ZNV9_9HYPH|nr:hypothetical protein [Pseudovibrio axinellae]KZL20103.1 hypothetical protein PsAD2_01590 [Pseudovibrio axinellae]SEQ25224.1 hypothetical protein SAMN05421798_102247 [Pseudovibrio axinellae]